MYNTYYEETLTAQHIPHNRNDSLLLPLPCDILSEIPSQGADRPDRRKVQGSRAFHARGAKLPRAGNGGHAGSCAPVARIKGRTSNVLNREFPELQRRLPTLWTRSKFIASVGSVSLDVVKQYIENQKGR